MKYLIKTKSNVILIITQIFILMLILFPMSNSYATETTTKQIEISKVNVQSSSNFIITQDKPIILKKKKERKSRIWLFVILASLLIALSILATYGVGFLALLFAWDNAYPILALITLILGLPAVALGSIFSSKALIKRFFKKNKSKKQDSPLSDNKRKKRSVILGIVSAIIGLAVPIIYFLFFL